MENFNPLFTEDVIVKTANEYSRILSFDGNIAIKEKERDVDETIEAVLTRLDEFYGMLDMIRTDVTTVTDEVLLNFKAERAKMQRIYAQIDDLERFVEVVKNDYLSMDKQVREAEAEFGSVNSIKKALTGFKLSSLWNKTETRPKETRTMVDYIPAPVFSTSEYISPKVKNLVKKQD